MNDTPIHGIKLHKIALILILVQMFNCGIQEDIYTNNFKYAPCL